MIQGKMLIDGQLVDSESGRWIDAVNPATEEVVGQVPRGSAGDVDRAVAAAQAAQPAWQALGVEGRAAYLRKLAGRLSARGEEILRVEVMDTGNTITPMRGDVDQAVWALRYYAGLGLEIKGETVPATAGNYHFTLREPYGVVGRIIPFNHPVMFAGARLGAPLMAGNTVVLKPPSEASLSATIFAEICREVLPPGVVSIVTGSGGEAGEALVRHPRVKRLAFIGSVKTGMAIQKAAAEVAVKYVTLELGGKNPMIVFPDADLGKAIPSAVAGMNFAWQGQSCGSTSRLFLHDSIYDAAVEEIKHRVESLRLGDPMDENSQMGPVVSRAQYQKVMYYIQAGKEDGARLVTGGVRPQGRQFEKGYWVRPTVFADVTRDMRIFREEIFGPVLSVIRWSDPDEVIDSANSVEYGLTASVWTENLRTALNTVRRIQAGYVWVNGVATHFDGTPFGGVKNSGVGRDEGLDEMLSYTENKTVHVILDK